MASFSDGAAGFIGWLGLLVKCRIWFPAELDFGEHAQSVSARNRAITNVVLVVSTLGLNDNCGNLSSLRMNDGAMRQTDVNMDGASGVETVS